MSAAARVDLDAITSSVAACRAAAPSAEVMAVVKADGYGHGLVPSARAALAGGASWLGTAQVAEALALRAAGVRAPVLSWLNAPGEAMAEALAAGVDIAVSAPWALEEVVAAASTLGSTARLHLKVDTGLARNGAAEADWPALLTAAAKAAADASVEVVGIMSHFVHADSPTHPETDRQVRRFAEALDLAESMGVHPSLRHLANSAATLTRPDTHYDLVRPGIACYGLSPVPAVAGSAALGLEPAMTLTAPVALTKRVARGAGASYGHVWHAPADTGLALIPLGYADGVPRRATNIAEVWLGGARRRIAGRVCMDQFVVSTGDDALSAGDEAVLFGPGHDGEPTAQDWADWLDTIHYEIVTRVGARVPRVYRGVAAEPAAALCSGRANQLRLLGTVGGGLAAGILLGRAAERRVVRGPRVRADEQGRRPLRVAPPERYRTVAATDATRLHVEEIGEPDAALTVVFSHGWTMDVRNWLFQRRDLAGPGVRLVLWDQRGHGQSERPADLRSCTIEQFARDLDRVVTDCAPTGPVVLVGHSMGGMTIMGLADSHPEYFAPRGRVVGVALLSTSAGQTAQLTLGLPAVLGRLLSRTRPGLARGLSRFGDRLEPRRPVGTDLTYAVTRRMSFASQVDPALVDLMEQMVGACPLPVMGACLEELLRHDKLAALPALAQTPTLVLVGDADVLTPVEHSRAIAAALPDAELAVLAGAGHMAHLERPGEVTTRLRHLLERAAAQV